MRLALRAPLLRVAEIIDVDRAFLVEMKPLGGLDEWLRMHPKMATLLRVRSGDRRDTHPRWQRNRECGRIPLRPLRPRQTMTSSGPEAYVTFGPILDSVIPGPPCRTHRNSAIAPIHSLVLWKTYLITQKHGALSKKNRASKHFFLILIFHAALVTHTTQHSTAVILM